MAITTDQLIIKYPKIFQQYEGNPGMVNWYGVPDGWLPVVDKLCGAIQNYIDNFIRYTKDGEWRPQQVTCVQMKEKFGGLRFYTNGNDDYVEGMINMAEHICYHTCQNCGSERNIGQTEGWISTLCEECAEDAHTWKPYKVEEDV